MTVEDCPLCLCVTAFHRAGMFADPVGSIRPLTWTDANGFLLGRIKCRFTESGSGGLSIYIRRQCARINVLVVRRRFSLLTFLARLAASAAGSCAAACGAWVGFVYRRGSGSSSVGIATISPTGAHRGTTSARMTWCGILPLCNSHYGSRAETGSGHSLECVRRAC
jgi:hypothetical protein